MQKVRTNIEMFIFEILREAQQVSFKRGGEGGVDGPILALSENELKSVYTAQYLCFHVHSTI